MEEFKEQAAAEPKEVTKHIQKSHMYVYNMYLDAKT